MTINELLNTKYLPKTNKQIQKASPKKIAQTIAWHFLFNDISEMGRSFDDLWENGRGNEIAKEFSGFYSALPDLQKACKTYPNSQYFSIEMIKYN